MMKIKGEEYPVSPCRFLLPDETYRQLCQLTKGWNMINHNHTLTVIINQYYNQYIQLASANKQNADNERRQEEMGEQSPGDSKDDSNSESNP